MVIDIKAYGKRLDDRYAGVEKHRYAVDLLKNLAREQEEENEGLASRAEDNEWELIGHLQKSAIRKRIPLAYITDFKRSEPIRRYFVGLKPKTGLIVANVEIINPHPSLLEGQFGKEVIEQLIATRRLYDSVYPQDQEEILKFLDRDGRILYTNMFDRIFKAGEGFDRLDKVRNIRLGLQGLL